MYEDITLINELSIFGRGPDKKQRKKRSNAMNVTGAGLIAGGAYLGSDAGTIGIKALSKEIKLRRNKSQIYKKADEAKKTWKEQSRKNHPDLVTDPKEKLLREEITKKLNNDYEKTIKSKTDLDDWKSKGIKDKIKSTADDVYDDLYVNAVKKQKGIDLSDTIKSPANQAMLRQHKNKFIKGIKTTGLLGAGLGVAGIGVLATNKILSNKKKKRK